MDTVTIASKLPNGLILRVGDEQVKVLGARVPFGEDPIAVHTYALTPNVDADFATKWFEENKSLDMVKKGILFMQAKMPDARAQARDYAGLKSGFEGLDPDKPGPGLERLKKD